MLYWVVAGALIASKDRGKSWTKLSDLKDGRFGPVFGKGADHLFVCGGLRIKQTDEKRYLAMLRGAARRGIRVGSLSTGSMSRPSTRTT